MKYETAATPYTASYLIFRQAGRIAFLQRENTPWMNGYWGLPSGKVDKEGSNGSESFTSAAIHEAEEEVGAKIKSADLKHLLTMHRNVPDQDMVWVDAFFEVTDWQGDLHNAEPQHHKALDFFDPDELPENIIPSIRFALDAIAVGKTYVEYGWD
jgi:ADP-ribose pyrophosphatase YjhB (NUDIX family)